MTMVMMVDKGDGIRGIDANLNRALPEREEGVRTCIIYLLVATIVRWSLLVYGQSTSLRQRSRGQGQEAPKESGDYGC